MLFFSKRQCRKRGLGYLYKSGTPRNRRIKCHEVACYIIHHNSAIEDTFGTPQKNGVPDSWLALKNPWVARWISSPHPQADKALGNNLPDRVTRESFPCPWKTGVSSNLQAVYVLQVDLFAELRRHWWIQKTSPQLTIYNYQDFYETG